jgi:hypothetical protein
MNKEKLCFPKKEDKIAELNALCAENIKMMILDETKIPNSNLSPAIKELCDDIYYWQRGDLESSYMRFNLTTRNADKRFCFPDHLYLIDVSAVNVVIGHHILSEDSEVSLVRLGNIIVDGLLREYEVRNRVLKNIYWEELSDTNSLLLDLIPSRVKRKLFERDVEDSDISAHMIPQVSYLRLVHNAMAWISLYDEIEENDLIFDLSDSYFCRTLRSQLDSLLAKLWEPIDSLREYVQYKGHSGLDSVKQRLITW